MKMQTDDVDQVRCWTSDEGHVWLHYYDTLPPRVREYLRDAPFNLCPACLTAVFLPKVPPEGTREQRLFKAIAVMEAAVREGGPSIRPSIRRRRRSGARSK